MNTNQEQFLNENLLRYSNVHAALESFQNLLMDQMRSQMKSLSSWLDGAKEVRPYTAKEIWCQYKDLKKHKHVWLLALFLKFPEGHIQPGVYLEIHESSEKPMTEAIEKCLKGKSLKYESRGAYRFYITPENPESIKDLGAITTSLRVLVQTANDILNESAGK